MKFLFYILALTTYVSAASISHQKTGYHNSLHNTGRIVGGHPATIEQYPYMASLHRNFFNGKVPFRHFCGASIYSERVVITAAHCVEKRGPELLKVSVGSTYKNRGILLPVKEVIMHENFTRLTYDNDIALVVVDTPIPLNNKTMKAIKLAKNGPNPGEIGTITGWGTLKEDGNEPDDLRAAELPIVSNEDCSKDYDGDITDLQFCAGYRGVGKIDSCQGDSGGPIAVKGKLAGIISWGQGCALPDYPGVYTRVSLMRSWIKEKLSKINVY